MKSGPPRSQDRIQASKRRRENASQGSPGTCPHSGPYSPMRGLGCPPQPRNPDSKRRAQTRGYPGLIPGPPRLGSFSGLSAAQSSASGVAPAVGSARLGAPGGGPHRPGARGSGARKRTQTVNPRARPAPGSPHTPPRGWRCASRRSALEPAPAPAPGPAGASRACPCPCPAAGQRQHPGHSLRGPPAPAWDAECAPGCTAGGQAGPGGGRGTMTRGRSNASVASNDSISPSGRGGSRGGRGAPSR